MRDPILQSNFQRFPLTTVEYLSFSLAHTMGDGAQYSIIRWQGRVLLRTILHDFAQRFRWRWMVVGGRRETLDVRRVGR